MWRSTRKEQQWYSDYMRSHLRRAGVSKKRMNVINPKGYRARHKRKIAA